MEVGVEQLVSEQLKSECTNICPNVATILFLVLHSSAHFLSTNYLRAAYSFCTRWMSAPQHVTTTVS